MCFKRALRDLEVDPVPSALDDALQAPRSVGTNEKPDVSCDRDVSSDAVSADCADAMSCSICSVVYSGKK